MMFYLASNVQLPGIEFNLESPSFNAKEIDASEQSVRDHFSLNEVLYIGSDEGCGCGFRHALIENDEWIIVSEAEEGFQKNHVGLYEFISKNIENGFVEIYGCWDGDISEPTKMEQEINLPDLLNENFHFLERGMYKVRI